MAFDRLIFRVGSGATDPATGRLAGAEIERQTEQCLKNVQTILEAAGSGLPYVLRCGVLPDRHARVRADERRLQPHVRRPPARAHDVQVSGLPGDGLRVEIDAIAYRPD
jgi:2-iminobutanoate/2-iminopropanoate deaminase